jgi:4-hydroxybenzoate polyprenyltransferase
MQSLKNYLSLIKFSHTLFALPFSIIGFFLGVTSLSPIRILSWLQENYGLFILVMLCMLFARSAAMAFNRWADYSYDKQNTRTHMREIPGGIIPPKSALTFVVLNCFFFVLTTFFINEICFYLSPIALMVILGYSYTKRFTPLCHVILGIGLSLAPLGSYLAVTGKFDWLPLFFSFIVLFWVSGFDILYSLQDEEFDRLLHLKSIPVLIGKKNALNTSRVFHSIAGLIMLWVGYYAHYHAFYYIGAGLFISLLFYQHSLVKENDLSKINLAFFTTNGIGSIVFAAFVLVELFLH